MRLWARRPTATAAPASAAGVIVISMVLALHVLAHGVDANKLSSPGFDRGVMADSKSVIEDQLARPWSIGYPTTTNTNAAIAAHHRFQQHAQTTNNTTPPSPPTPLPLTTTPSLHHPLPR